MPKRTMGAVASVAIFVALLVTGLVPASAPADTTCSYDGGAKTLTVDGEPDRGTFLSVSGGEILVHHLVLPSGSELINCAGPSDPTVTNTDAINVDHASDAETSVNISHIGNFAPGPTDEGGVLCADEIEIQVELGGPFSDPVYILSPPGNLVLGDSGLDWNPAGIELCQDVDLSVAATAPFWHVFAGLGSNEDLTFSAQGSPATGPPSGDRVHFVGGKGDARFIGGTSHDILDGNSGRDVLRGDKGDDVITGGPGGNDRLFGDHGKDLLHAKDGKRDGRIDCGPGNDKKAKRDKNKDPDPKSC